MGNPESQGSASPCTKTSGVSSCGGWGSSTLWLHKGAPTLCPCNSADSLPPAPPVSSLAVSISDVERVREGHESELLRSLAEEFPLEQGFTIVFHGRRSNLDLVANSVEEAKIWMQGLQHLVDFVTGMDQQERLDQYQRDGVTVGARGH